MTRLSANTREQMACALVRHAFNLEGEALVVRSRTLFAEVYDAHYPADVQRHMKALTKATGRKAFDQMSSVKVNANGPTIQIGAIRIGYGEKWEVKKDITLPRLRDLDYTPTISLQSDNPLCAEVLAFGMAVEKFNKDCEVAYNEALGTLGQFNSVKQLEATWPDALPVIGHLIPEGNRTLPVVQVETLNAKFKLPPGPRAARR